MNDIALPPIDTHRLEDSQVFAMDVTPRTREKEFQNKLKKRVKRLMNKKENRICLDCSKPKPKWATLISVTPPHEVPHESYGQTYFVGGFCCLECSGAHRRLGTHVSFVRSIELDTLKEHEVKALEYGGNKIVNNIYEGSMFGTHTSYDEKGIEVEMIRPDSESGQKVREAFIRDKYEKKKYINIKAMAKFRMSMMKRGIKSPLALASPSGMSTTDQISPTSTNGSDSASSPLQLQIFTSSPRTLALIDKYMNPKPKKKKVLRKMRFPLRKFQRKSQFKGSIMNLRGVVNSNPNLQIVETRSEDLDQSSNDGRDNFDMVSDTSSVTSTKSSMSAAVRRGFIRSKTSTTKKSIGTPNFMSPSHSSGRITPTPTSTKAMKRRNFFRRNSNHHGSKLHEYPPEEEKEEVFESDPNINAKKESLVPTSPSSSSNASIRSRLPNLLRTPKLKTKNKNKNSSGGSGKSKGSIFFWEETGAAGLDIVEEDTPSRYNSNRSNSDEISQHEEIRAMEAWSIKFDRVISKLFKKRKISTPTMLDGLSSSDEHTVTVSEEKHSCEDDSSTSGQGLGNNPVWSY